MNESSLKIDKIIKINTQSKENLRKKCIWIQNCRTMRYDIAKKCDPRHTQREYIFIYI